MNREITNIETISTNIEKEKKLPKLEGIDINTKEIRKAVEDDRPLQISVAFPRQKCNLNCQYCSTSEHDKKGDKDKSIDIKKLLSSLDDAQKIGVKYLLLPGYGEPFMNKEIWQILEHAKDLGMYIIILTNGSLLDKQQIEKLKEYPVTLIFKCNSLDTEKEDKIAGIKNYAAKRNEALKMAIDAGFNVPDKNGNIRMGLSAMIYKNNADDIVRWLQKSI